MTKDFEKELKWFLKRMLQIRLLDVRGFDLPIPFELSEIKECTAAEFSSEMTPREHLEEMIEEIRGFYIKNSNKHTNRDDIKLEFSGDNDSFVKIFGINSDLLRLFMVKRLKIKTSLLETRANNVLFFVEVDTGITLNSTGQNILAKLRALKETGDTLLYDEIFEICANHKSDKENSFRRRNGDEEKRKMVARGTISDLLGKIKESEMFELIEKEKIIENVREEGYKLVL